MENFALIALLENLRPAMSELVIRRVVPASAQWIHFPDQIRPIPSPQNCRGYPTADDIRLGNKAADRIAGNGFFDGAPEAPDIG